MNIRFLMGTIWLHLHRRPYEALLAEDVVNPPIRTLPSEFAQLGETFRLFPTPYLAFPLELLCNDSPPPPVAPTDENFWTRVDGTGAGTLIILSACAEICFGPLTDPQRGQLFEARAKRESDSLTERSQRLAGPLYIQPYL